MQVEERPIASIKPYANNPRLNDEAVDAVAASIREEKVWLPIPRYEGLYEVSSCGQVRRASTSRMAPAGYRLQPRVT